MVRTEGTFEFARDGYCRILFYQYASQGTPPCSSVSPVKTEGEEDYYGERTIICACQDNKLRIVVGWVTRPPLGRAICSLIGRER